jgi:hypothetical protein
VNCDQKKDLINYGVERWYNDQYSNYNSFDSNQNINPYSSGYYDTDKYSKDFI